LFDLNAGLSLGVRYQQLEAHHGEEAPQGWPCHAYSSQLSRRGCGKKIKQAAQNDDDDDDDDNDESNKGLDELKLQVREICSLSPIRIVAIHECWILAGDPFCNELRAEKW
jgi:hypothetical protein